VLALAANANATTITGNPNTIILDPVPIDVDTN
jgi:hypothetical protein